MRVACLGVMGLAVSGCAQIAGLDKTTGAPVDAPPGVVDGRRATARSTPGSARVAMHG